MLFERPKHSKLTITVFSVQGFENAGEVRRTKLPKNILDFFLGHRIEKPIYLVQPPGLNSGHYVLVNGSGSEITNLGDLVNGFALLKKAERFAGSVVHRPSRTPWSCSW